MKRSEDVFYVEIESTNSKKQSAELIIPIKRSECHEA
jgi:hypothetical protein